VAPNRIQISFLTALCLALSWTSNAADTYYWDNNAASTGFGTAGGTWSSTASLWNADTDGNPGPTGTAISTALDSLNFGNGATGLAAGTITVSGTVDSGNMTFASGSAAITLSGGTINFGTTSTITVNNSTTINSVLTGAGTSLTRTGAGKLTLSGDNNFSGGISSFGTGVLALTHRNAAGTGTINFATTQNSYYNTFELSGGINVANDIIMDSATGRNTITSIAGVFSNILSSNITINNNGANLVVFQNLGNAGTTFTVGGATPNSTTITAASFASSISFRGAVSSEMGLNVLNSRITAPNAKFDVKNYASLTVNSTGNSWTATTLFNNGKIKLGATDALATGAQIQFENNQFVDLNGFNQTVAGLSGTLTGSRIKNDSATTDSTLTLAGLTDNRSFSGAIMDGSNGKKTSLVVNNSNAFTQTLAGANAYTGTTTISAGTLALGASNVLPETQVSIGSAKLLVGAGFTEATGRLNVTGAATLQLGSNTSSIAFAANGDLSEWTGTLDITGNFVPNASVRFGADAGGLTAAQLAKITVNGVGGYTLNAYGYLGQPVPPKHYDVYLIAGQSNADGRGYNSALTGSLASYAGQQPGVKIFYANPINKDPVNPTWNTGWRTLEPGYSVIGTVTSLPSTSFGFEVSLGKALAAKDPSRNVAIIKVSQGGTSLANDWDPAGGANFMWRTFANKVPEAMAALTATGDTAEICGMFWHQGESDGDNLTYESDLTQFIAACRTLTGKPNLPFAIGELERDDVTPNASGNINDRTYPLNVMANVAADDPDTFVVSSAGLMTYDATHFTTADYITFGERFAQAYFDLLDRLNFTVTWPTAALITEGQALSASALSGGSASVSGSFAFANPSTVPPAGTYPADVIFTPTDAATYATVPSTVNVTVRTRFEAWTNDEAISFSSDANGDGTADGLAWLLGAEAASQNARGLLPAPTEKNGALEIRFTMRNQTTRGSAVLNLQFGTTLDSWTNVMIPEETGSQGDVGFVITPEGDLNHVVVTIPSTAAGSKFARLSGTEN